MTTPPTIAKSPVASNATSPRLLCVGEAAKRLSLSVQAIYALCDNKEIVHYRIGPKAGKIVIPESAIDDYLSRHLIASVAGQTITTPKPLTKPKAAKSAPRLRHLKLE